MGSIPTHSESTKYTVFITRQFEGRNQESLSLCRPEAASFSPDNAECSFHFDSARPRHAINCSLKQEVWVPLVVKTSALEC